MLEEIRNQYPGCRGPYELPHEIAEDYRQIEQQIHAIKNEKATARASKMQTK